MRLPFLLLLSVLSLPNAALAAQVGGDTAADTLPGRWERTTLLENALFPQGQGTSGQPLLDRGSEIRVSAPRAFTGIRTGHAVSLEGDLLVFTPASHNPPFLRVVLDPTVELSVKPEPRLNSIQWAALGLGGGALVGAVLGYLGPEECIGSQPCSRPARTFVGGVRTGIIAGATTYLLGVTVFRPRWIRILERQE